MTLSLQMPYLEAWGSAIGIVVLGAVLTLVVAVAVLYLKPRTARVASAADAAGPDADFGPASGPDQDIDIALDGPPTHRESLFAQDVACYLASERPASGVRYWPAPPVVPGRRDA